ncbi:hypothetical protein J437_LFUL014453 [Ladona fulva]|uniref:Uncharacterized protein n=1 Tax=Ladona fulva TaxID=123851 RepID=A0A8K0P5N4_LADFU|nr:hypothetical protein J437_LFUL014453 [Ladona fulva]
MNHTVSFARRTTLQITEAAPCTSERRKPSKTATNLPHLPYPPIINSLPKQSTSPNTPAQPTWPNQQATAANSPFDLIDNSPVNIFMFLVLLPSIQSKIFQQSSILLITSSSSEISTVNTRIEAHTQPTLMRMFYY